MMTAHELAEAERRSIAIQLALLPNKIMSSVDEDSLCLRSAQDLVEAAIGQTVSTLENRFRINVSDFVMERCCDEDGITHIPVNRISEAFWDMVND